MNDGQKMFHDFFLSLVQEGKEAEAERVLAESFAKQADGTFTKEYFQSIVPVFHALIKPEHTEQLKKAMNHFSANL